MGFGEVPDKALGEIYDAEVSTAGHFGRCGWGKTRWVSMPTRKCARRRRSAVATAPIDSPIGVIDPGRWQAANSTGRRSVGDEVVVRITVNWLIGCAKLSDPAWTFGPEGQRYEMEVKGNPDISINVKGFQSEVGGEGPDCTASSAPRRTVSTRCPLSRTAGRRHVPRPSTDQRRGRARLS